MHRNLDQTCQAHYFAGIVLLTINDRIAARKEFTAVREGCPTSLREQGAAVADLKRLPQ